MAQVPAYERIREDLAAQIASGLFAASGRIPSETELADRYGVTRMTVRNAIGRLVEDGLLVRRHGAGTFVVDRPPVHRAHNELMSFTKEMEAQGYRVTTRVLANRVEPDVPSEVAEALQMKGDEPAISVRRLRYVDDHPVALQESWLPYGRCPALVRHELVNGSLYETLYRLCRIVLRHAEERIAAVAATPAQARLLETRRGVPLLQIERWTFDNENRPVEFVRSVNRHEYWLGIRLEASSGRNR